MTKRRQSPMPRPERYVGFRYWEIDSPAFAHLSADATRVYLFMRTRANFSGDNNGKVPFSHRDAAKALHSAWRRGSNALDELQHFGFIKPRVIADPGLVPVRPATEWQLTAFRCGGQEPSTDFLRWDGTPFTPQHRSKLGRSTMEQRHSAAGMEGAPEISRQKQSGAGNMQTPRRQREDASRPDIEISRPEAPKSVGNMKTPRVHRRRQHDDTTISTRQGGPQRDLALVVGSGASGRQRRPADKTGCPAPNGPEPDPTPSDVATHNALVSRLATWQNRGPAPDGIGDRMRKWREARGLSQAELALKAGMRVAKLCKLELGHQNMTCADYKALVRALAVDPLQIPPMLELQHS